MMVKAADANRTPMLQADRELPPADPRFRLSATPQTADGVAGNGSERRARWRRTPRAAEPDTGLAQLVRDLADDSRRLIRDEVELGKLELRQTARKLAADGGLAGAGAFAATLGAICLVVALALALGALIGSYWAGTLITGVVLIVAGGLMALKGLQAFRSTGLTPERTVESLRRDAEWAREEARDFKRQWSGG